MDSVGKAFVSFTTDLSNVDDPQIKALIKTLEDSQTIKSNDISSMDIWMANAPSSVKYDSKQLKIRRFLTDLSNVRSFYLMQSKTAEEFSQHTKELFMALMQIATKPADTPPQKPTLLNMFPAEWNPCYNLAVANKKGDVASASILFARFIAVFACIIQSQCIQLFPAFQDKFDQTFIKGMISTIYTQIVQQRINSITSEQDRQLMQSQAFGQIVIQALQTIKTCSSSPLYFQEQLSKLLSRINAVATPITTEQLSAVLEDVVSKLRPFFGASTTPTPIRREEPIEKKEPIRREEPEEPSESESDEDSVMEVEIAPVRREEPARRKEPIDEETQALLSAYNIDVSPDTNVAELVKRMASRFDEQLTELKKVNEAQEQERMKLSQKLLAATDDIRALESSVDTNVRALQQKEADLLAEQHQLAQLQAQLTQLQSTDSSNKSEVATLKQSIASQKDLIQQQTQTIRQYEQQIKQVESQLSAPREASREATQDVDAIKAAYEVQIATLQQQLAQARREAQRADEDAQGDADVEADQMVDVASKQKCYTRRSRDYPTMTDEEISEDLRCNFGESCQINDLEQDGTCVPQTPSDSIIYVNGEARFLSGSMKTQLYKALVERIKRTQQTPPTLHSLSTTLSFLQSTRTALQQQRDRIARYGGGGARR